jgi:acyl dehydratase
VARIDDFGLWQHVTFTKTFTDEDVQRFIAHYHVDDAFAAKTRFGRRVLHGMLTASLFSTMVGMLLPGTGAIYRFQTLNILRAVHVGERISSSAPSIARSTASSSMPGSRTRRGSG